MKLAFRIILLLAIIAVQRSVSQTISAKATLDTGVITIGDQIKLKLDITYPKKLTPGFPALSDTLTEKIEIIGKPKTDTLKAEGDWLTLRQTYTITSFDSGYHAIPPFDVTFSEKGDTALQHVLSNAILLGVNTIPVDTTQTFKDIKEPLDAPLTFEEILPYILWSLLGIAIIIAAIYVIKRIRSKKPILLIPEKPKEPAHIIALRELHELKEKKLWQQGLIKKYYSDLSEITRKYLEDGLDLLALEMTTADILINAKNKKFDEKSVLMLKQLLELSDLVKFAKYSPVANEHDLALQQAVDLVHHTTRIASVQSDHLPQTQNHTQEK